MLHHFCSIPSSSSEEEDELVELGEHVDGRDDVEITDEDTVMTEEDDSKSSTEDEKSTLARYIDCFSL